MKAEDISKMTSTALMTLVIVLAAFGPGLIGFGAADAANDLGGNVTRIGQPVLRMGGIELRLDPADGQTLTPGDEPVFTLTAFNTKGKPTTVTVETLMTFSRKPSRLSRNPAMPTEIRQSPLTLSIGKKETRIVSLSTHTKLPADSRVDVYLRATNAEEERSNPPADLIRMLSISTIVDPPAPQ